MRDLRRRSILLGMSSLPALSVSKAAAAGAMKLFLCGDVMLGRGIDQILPDPVDPVLYEAYVTSALDYVRLAERANGPIPRPVDENYVWGAALEALRLAQPDVRIVNLETSITRSPDHRPKGINYRMSPGNVGALTAGGVDCCVLANNHVLDWGTAGLLDTLDTLHARGVKTAGAGRDLDEAAAPAVLDVPGKGRALVAALCTPSSGVPADWAAAPGRPGVNLESLTEAAVERVMRGFGRLRRPGDVEVVSVHWGPNWGYGVPAPHRRFAHALIDRGVSVVHGHSSHHPMAIEVYKGRLVLYGCGDLINDYEGISGEARFRGDLAQLYFASIGPAGALGRLEMTPLQLRRLRLNRASEPDIEWMAERLARECRKFGGRIERRGSRLELSWTGAAVPESSRP